MDLVELLWWDVVASRREPRRGPRPRWSTPQVVQRAIRIADEEGLGAVTIRALAQALQITPMSVYTHVSSRDELLVLMADRAHAELAGPPLGEGGWRRRVRAVAESNLALLKAHPWLLDIDDHRTALGPGTIAKYDRELHAFDGTALSDVDRDAALTFVLDFTRAAARRLTATEPDFDAIWHDAADRLAELVGEDYPLARRVGAVAGEQQGAPYDPRAAWEFGLERVLAGLADAIGG